MLRSSLCMLTCILIMASLYAQKVDMEKVPVSFTQLPSQPLDPEFTTYSVYLYGSTSSIEDMGYTRSSLAKRVKMHAFKRVPRGGHFRVTIRVGYLSIGDSKTQSYKRKVKDGDNEVEKTYYKKVITWKLPVYYKMDDYKGNVISEGTYGTDYKTEEWGAGATSSSALSKSWRSSRLNVYKKWRKDAVISNTDNVASLVKGRHDFYPRSYNINMGALKDKKSKNFNVEAYRTALESVTVTFTRMKADEPVDVLKPEVKEAVDFWKSEEGKYSISDKKLRKVKHVCLYNLAQTFYYLDELDEAKKYATQCQEIKWKDGRPKRLLSSIERTRKLFETNKMTTRHPKFDLTNAKPPASSAFGAIDESDADEGGATTLPGFLTNSSGDKAEGNFTISAGDGEELKFGSAGNVSFTFVKDGRNAEDKMDPSSVKEFSFSERKFFVKDFAPGAKGNTTEKACILESLYNSPAITVFKYYPYDDKLGDQQVEFAFQKTADEKPVSTSSTTFLLFNKGLAKYFADCADLAEAAGTGEFKKSQDDIIRAARVYAEMCQ